MMSQKIEDVCAWQAYDSRGRPTVAARVRLESGASGLAMVPSGASTGLHEAVELRDGDGSVNAGAGVLKAVANVNAEIRSQLLGCDAEDQERIDQLLIAADGTPDKSHLGANAVLAASLATARAFAEHNHVGLYRHLHQLYRRLGRPSAETRLPAPMFNILNGGRHAANKLDIQEFMVQPLRSEDMEEALRIGAEIYHALGVLLHEKGMMCGVGDEGGFAPAISSTKEAIELVLLAAERAKWRPGYDIGITLDVAASEMYHDGRYAFTGEDMTMDAFEFSGWLEGLVAQYPIISIEDALAEDDWLGWGIITQRLGERIQLVGDDLFTTQTERIKRGVDEGCGNALLVKMNQVGTLTETFQAMALAENHDYARIVSHRSGETEDTSIADLAVATGAGQIKTGAPARSERVAKYNRLLRIARELDAPMVTRHGAHKWR